MKGTVMVVKRLVTVKWVLILAGTVAIGFVALVGAFYGVLAIAMGRAANEGSVALGSTIYGAKDETSLQALEKYLNDRPYLNPDDVEDLVKKSHGGVVGLAPKTRVRYKNEFTPDGQAVDRLEDYKARAGNTLRIKVLDGSGAGLELVIPKQYTWAITFNWRAASL